jgi:hypothetical protein
MGKQVERRLAWALVTHPLNAGKHRAPIPTILDRY